MTWLIVKLDIVDSNCLYGQVHVHTEDASGAISTLCYSSISSFLFQRWRWQWQTGHLLKVSEPCTQIHGSESDWALEIVKIHATIRHEFIESLIIAWNHRVAHNHRCKQSTQYRHGADKLCWARAGPKMLIHEWKVKTSSSRFFVIEKAYD